MRDALEIERKFLLEQDSLPSLAEGEEIVQAYLGFEPVTRVRLRAGLGSLTVKGPGLHTRREVEIEITPEEARTLLDLRVPGTRLIEKVRYRVSHGGRIWEVDVFGGELRGLVLAEVELSSRDQVFELPPWVGPEVTEDPRYQNSNLARTRRLPEFSAA